MMSEARVWETNILRNLQQALEARGLTFYVHPPRDLMPDFLGDYQPDAIAVGPEGGTIIEMKDRKKTLCRRGRFRQLLSGSPASKAGSFASSI